MKRNLVQIPLFVVSISPAYEGEIAIINNRTGKFASKKLKPLSKIKKEFKSFITDDKTMLFRFLSQNHIEQIQSMLPTTKLTCN